MENQKEPIIIKDKEIMRKWSEENRKQNKIIGFVPTMGFLHNGHLSLVEIAKKNSDKTVVSIFVNPTQFGPNEDFDKYPRDLEGDIKKLTDLSVDVVFVPDEKNFYPEHFQTYVNVEQLTKPLCGAKREGHFRGVTTVVTKLFNVVKPHKAVFGYKDYQQITVIRQMVDDLDMDIEIIGGEIVREADGLAMSSRNVYLSPELRQEALILGQSLIEAEKKYKKGEFKTPDEIEKFVYDMISTKPSAKIDYVSCLDARYLVQTETLDTDQVLAVAVFFDKTRLIDNIILKK